MFIAYLHNAIRFSAMFIFGSTGETITEKSGHLNLGIPGIMCMGALGGYVGESMYMHSLTTTAQINGFAAVFIAVLFAMLFAGFGGAIYGFLTISLRCNQNVSGLAITTFGTGLTSFIVPMIDKKWFNYASNAFRAFAPGMDKAGWFGDLFLTYGCLVYIAIFVAILTTIIFKYTRIGLSLRAVGENPATADAAGINVTKYKYVACVLGAAIAGLGGLFYIMDYHGGNWEYDVDAMGWLAIALVIFSIWRPNWGILGAILFGALTILPYQSFAAKANIAQRELIIMVPFVVTVIILIITSIINKRETQPPSALGLSYFREER